MFEIKNWDTFQNPWILGIYSSNFGGGGGVTIIIRSCCSNYASPPTTLKSPDSHPNMIGGWLSIGWWTNSLHTLDIQTSPEVRRFRHILRVQIPCQEVLGCLGIGNGRKWLCLTKHLFWTGCFGYQDISKLDANFSSHNSMRTTRTRTEDADRSAFFWMILMKPPQQTPR